MQYKQLIATALFVAAASAETGKLGDAAPIYNNPVNQTYVAELSGKVTGFIRAVAGAGGKGVDFEVSLKSCDESIKKPLSYHIHDAPVTTDCASTLAHLDPYQRGQATPCDASKPETCEVGDLAGKHGKVEAVPYSKSYNDLFASTKPGIGAFFGNRSIVIHAGDEAKTRIACANFVLEKYEESDDECEEWETDSDDEDDHSGKPGKPGKPHPSKPLVTGTVTVTAPCDKCAGKTTVYTTTTVCPEDELPGYTGKPSGPKPTGDHAGSPVKPHQSKPVVTKTATVTAPCDSCAGKTTVYTTTTVCPEDENPTYVPSQPGKPGHWKSEDKPGHGKPGHPVESDKAGPGKPGHGDSGKPGYPAGTGKPHVPVSTGSAGKPGHGAPSTPGGGKNATSPVSPSGKPSTSLPATYTPGSGAASFGASSAVALVAGVVALMAAL